MHYQKLEHNIVRCNLCPHNCKISDGKVGFCSVRKNENGTLYSLVYGRPASIAVDPIEKKPLNNFHPGSQILSLTTVGCNLRCKFCQNHDISQAHEIENLEKVLDKTEYKSPENIIQVCANEGLEFIAFTYTEPTVYYEYMLDIAKLAKKNNIKTVMVSNGMINPEPLKKLIQYIDAFNIDLKSWDTKFYTELTNGNLDAVKKTIEFIAKSKKAHIEVTNLVIDEYNDDPVLFEEMCKWLSGLDNKITFHISRSFPYYKMKKDFDPTPIDTLKKFEKIAKKYLENVYVGNVV